MTVHLVTYEHADDRLSRVRAFAEEEPAQACFDEWVRSELADGESGTAAGANAFDPEGAVAVWRGSFGSRIVRLEVVL